MPVFIPVIVALVAAACSTRREGDVVYKVGYDSGGGPDGKITPGIKDVYVSDADAPSVDLAVDQSPVDLFQKDVPDLPTSPDIPDIVVAPDAPDLPTPPDVPDVVVTPDTPDLPTPPDVPDVVITPDAPDIPDIPPPPSCDPKIMLPEDCAIMGGAAGGDVSCIIKSGTVYCTGKILKSTNPTLTLFSSTQFIAIPGLTNAATVVTSGNDICAILKSGGISCLGQNAWGQLGNGSQGFNADSTTAGAVQKLTAATTMSAGYYHNCALQSGKAFCWGHNVKGQLGLGAGSASTASLPAEITTITDMTDLRASALGNCGIHKSGAVYCWGDNESGQLGLPNAGPIVYAPTFVTKSALHMATGSDFTLVMDPSCVVSAVGAGGLGQLGLGVAGNKSTLTLIKAFTEISDIFAGGQTACAIKTNGDLYCWGDNTFGQVGNGKSGDTVLSPTKISGMQPVVHVAVGNGHTCAIDTSCHLYCWGHNQSGQLGTGNTKDSTIPIQIKL